MIFRDVKNHIPLFFPKKGSTSEPHISTFKEGPETKKEVQATMNKYELALVVSAKLMTK